MSNDDFGLKIIDSSRKELQDIAVRSVHLASPMRKIAAKIVNSVHKNFEVGGRYSSDGSPLGGSNKWKAVKAPPTYKGKSEERGTILCRSTHLMQSVMPESTDDTASASTNVEYGAIQNFGGTTKAHVIKPRNGNALAFNGIVRRSVHHPGSKLPARPYMVIQPEDLTEYEKILADYVLGQGTAA